MRCLRFVELIFIMSGPDKLPEFFVKLLFYARPLVLSSFPTAQLSVPALMRCTCVSLSSPLLLYLICASYPSCAKSHLLLYESCFFFSSLPVWLLTHMPLFQPNWKVRTFGHNKSTMNKIVILYHPDFEPFLKSEKPAGFILSRTIGQYLKTSLTHNEPSVVCSWATKIHLVRFQKWLHAA